MRDNPMYVHWIHPKKRAVGDKRLQGTGNSYRVLISIPVFSISSTKGTLSGVKSLVLYVRGWTFNLGYLIIILENNLIIRANAGKLIGNYEISLHLCGYFKQKKNRPDIIGAAVLFQSRKEII